MAKKNIKKFKKFTIKFDIDDCADSNPDFFGFSSPLSWTVPNFKPCNPEPGEIQGVFFAKVDDYSVLIYYSQMLDEIKIYQN